MVCFRRRTEISIVLLFSLEFNLCVNDMLPYNSSSLGNNEFKALTYYGHEARLRKEIFVNYSNLLRPAQTMQIYAALVILRINELDIHLEAFQFSGWLIIKWHDPRLTWHPRNYGDIYNIYDSELVLWRPEIVVDNSVKRIGVLGDEKLYLKVNYHGNVTWRPPNIFQTHCEVNPTYFPFDTQVCHMDIAVWGLTDQQVELYPLRDKINLDDFKENGEWVVVSSWVTRSKLLDGEELQSELYFFIKLRRRPVHYVLTILIPVVVTCLMTSLVFLVPTSSGAKIQYALTILLTYTVMLSIVTAYLPSSSNHVSVMSVFMTCILAFGVLINFLVVLIVNWYARPHESPVTGWVRFVIESGLLPFLSCKRPPCLDRQQSPSQTNLSPSKSCNPEVERINRASEDRKYSYRRNVGSPNERPSTVARLSLALDKYLQDVAQEHHLEPKLGQAGGGNHELTWRDCSEILNQFCLKFISPFVITLTFIGVLTLFVGGYTSYSQSASH